MSLWHVKNELESGHCDFYDGECCAKWLISDGTCDERNNFPTCSYHDGGDCHPPNITDWPGCPHNPALIGDGTCDDHLKTKAECMYQTRKSWDNVSLIYNF